MKIGQSYRFSDSVRFETVRKNLETKCKDLWGEFDITADEEEREIFFIIDDEKLDNDEEYYNKFKRIFNIIEREFDTWTDDYCEGI